MDFLLDNWIWASLAIVTGTWLLVDVLRSAGDKTQLSPVEATLLINREDAVIIDVRDIGEFSQGHIPNARHIPLAELPKREAELNKLKDKPLIFCCASGMRSGSAASRLKKQGFDKIYNLRGGMLEWDKAGQPISRGKKKDKNK